MNPITKYIDKKTYQKYNELSSSSDWHGLFNPESSEGQKTFGGIRFAVKTMIISLITTPLLLLANNPGAVLSAWFFILAYQYKGTVEAKMATGYPYLEVGDAGGLGCSFVITGLVAITVFIVWIIALN